MQRPRLLAVGAYACVCAALLGVLALATLLPGPSTRPVHADTGLLPLYELASRLLTPPSAHGSDEGRPHLLAQQVQLLPRQIPSAIPLAVPFPPNARLIGSLIGTRLRSDAPPPVEVVLDAPGAAEALVAFYQRELPKQGWLPIGAAAVPGLPGGFLPTWGEVRLGFCPSGTDWWLGVTIWPRPNRRHEVRVRLMETERRRGPCSAGAPAGPGHTGLRRVPPLHAPAGTLVTQGGRPERWSMQANVLGMAGAGEALAHLAPQLEAAGWRHRDGAAAGPVAGPVAWTTWRDAEERWEAILLLIEVPGQANHIAWTQVEPVSSPNTTTVRVPPGLGVLLPAGQTLDGVVERAPVTGGAGGAGAMAEAGDVAAPTSALDANPLEELVARLLAGPDAVADGRPVAVQLLAAALPPGWPADVPLPPEARLVGSAATAAPDSGAVLAVEAALDVIGVPGDALAFYRQALLGRGWTALPDESFPPWGAVFCSPGRDLSVGVTVWPNAGEAANRHDLRLSVRQVASRWMRCGEWLDGEAVLAAPPAPPAGAYGHTPLLSTYPPLLPPLIGPDGAPVSPHTHPDSWGTTADAATDVSAANLEAHYAAQLAAAGWQRRAAGAAGRVAWSAWFIPDSDHGGWYGFFVVLESPGAPHRTLWAYVVPASPAAQTAPAPREPAPNVTPPPLPTPRVERI